MSPLEIAIALAALVAAATVAGVAWKQLNGRALTTAGTTVISAQDISAPLGESATLMQFSSEICSACTTTRRVLAGFAQEKDVAHVEVDVAARPDLAKRFNILQTPTTLVLDASGTVRARIGGATRPEIVRAELDRLRANPAS